jgi:hypothetical protein
LNLPSARRRHCAHRFDGLIESRACAFDISDRREHAAVPERAFGIVRPLKGECIGPGTPLSLEDASRLVERHVEHYNDVRLNSAIGYITPKDMLAGRQQEIHAERDRKLEEARKQRQIRRQQAVKNEKRPSTAFGPTAI